MKRIQKTTYFDEDVFKKVEGMEDRGSFSDRVNSILASYFKRLEEPQDSKRIAGVRLGRSGGEDVRGRDDQRKAQ